MGFRVRDYRVALIQQSAGPVTSQALCGLLAKSDGPGTPDLPYAPSFVEGSRDYAGRILGALSGSLTSLFRVPGTFVPPSPTPTQPANRVLQLEDA